MSNVIFCATDFYLNGGYRSYVDFFKLVEMAGYPLIPLRQLNPHSDNTYIVTPLNDEWLDGWVNPSAHIIHWELEWRTDWRAEVNTPPGVAEVWTVDKWYAEQIGARYVPMGSDKRLNEMNDVKPPEKYYDVSLLSYQTGRRHFITKQLQDKGLSLAPISGLWGAVRSLALLRSRAMVHVHQHDHMQTVAPLRFALAAAHGLPIISESISDRGIFGYTSMVEADYQYLAAFTADMLKDERLLRDYAHALHGLLCEEYTFRKVVEAHV